MKFTITYEDNTSVVCNTREELDKALVDRRLITSIADSDGDVYTWEKGL